MPTIPSDDEPLRSYAADAFQDAWRRVVAAREGYEPEGKFESWLFTLVRRACIDLLDDDLPRDRRKRRVEWVEKCEPCAAERRRLTEAWSGLSPVSAERPPGDAKAVVLAYGREAAGTGA